MIIDTHVHFYEPALGDFAWPEKGGEFYRPFTPDMLAREAGEALTGCVLIGCSDEETLNLRLLDYTKDTPLVGAYIAQIDLSDPRCKELTGRYAAFPKYRGFRVYAPAALPFADRLPECVLPGTVVELLAPWPGGEGWRDFIAAHPEIPFIIQHFGGIPFTGAPVPEAYLSFLRDFAALPNVFIKLSGFFTLCQASPRTPDAEFYRGIWSAAMEAFGPHRCLYGSDWPVSRMPYPACIGVASTLCGEAAPQILCENACCLYRLPTD